MEQRRLRLGDILDDYCPRERRITNHAVVAMIDDTIKQTRCTTCDAEHEYKHAKVPAARRRKTAIPPAQLVDPAPMQADEDVPYEIPSPEEGGLAAGAGDVQDEQVADADVQAAVSENAIGANEESLEDESERERDDSDEWPVHRPLIRATLPRPEGQTPERKAPDFTFRSSGGGKFDPHRNGRHRGHRPMRHAQGNSPSGQGNSRFGGQRGPQGGPQGQRQGQRHGQPQGHGNRSGQGGGQGRPGQGRGGRKRGR